MSTNKTGFMHISNFLPTPKEYLGNREMEELHTDILYLQARIKNEEKKLFTTRGILRKVKANLSFAQSI